MSDTLVYAMSTRGSLRVEEFYKLLRFVYLRSNGMDEMNIDIDFRSQTIRNLDSLAYCEFDFDQRMVFMCKPALVLIPAWGLPKALLVGARTPQFIDKLKAVVKVNRSKLKIHTITTASDQSSLSSALHIHATDKEILKKIANQLGIDCDLEFPAAWKIAQMSTKLDEIEAKLKYFNNSEPNWKKRIFRSDRLVFTGHEKEQQNIYLTEYRHPVTKQLYHWIWNGVNAAQISRDWGRYIILAKTGKSIMLYDDKLYRLAVPMTVPLPCLLARAAALCSGVIPMSVLSFSGKLSSIPPKHPLQIYSCVPPDIAHLIAEKVQQKLIYTSLEKINKGVLYV